MIFRANSMALDAGGWRPRIDDATIERYRAEGAWLDRTIGDLLDKLCESRPEQCLVIDGVRTISAGTLREDALQLSRILAERGLRTGDVVSFQLPNWHEAILIELACAYGGYVCNPVVPIYRDAEVSFILSDAGTRVFFVPETFRGFDYQAMVARMKPNLPRLNEVVFTRPKDQSLLSFEQILQRTPKGKSLTRPDPNDVKLLLYTSGAPRVVLRACCIRIIRSIQRSGTLLIGLSLIQRTSF
jgi:cyclohexanecarboxylate-CoA ligase